MADVAPPPSAADLALQADDAAPDLDSGPSYYQLDDAAWAQIAVQYQSGATAKTLAKLWRVSAGTIYRHACAGGWTKAKRSLEVSQIMVARERERLALAEQIAGEAEAAAAPREADPIEAAETMLRRGAGSALKGRSADAKAALGLAQDLLRCARLLDEVTGARRGANAQAWADEEDEAPETPEEREALNAQIIAGLRRHAARRGRSPPKRLPAFCWLPENEQYRPLAVALDVIDADDNAVCPDFEAAVAACRFAGRGAELDAALRDPVPLEHCVWLTDEQKAAIEAQERGEGGALEGAVEPAPVEETAPGPAPPVEPPPVLRLGEPAAPWAHLQTGRRGLSTPVRYIGGP